MELYLIVIIILAGVFSLIALILALLFSRHQKSMEERLGVFLSGKDGKSLEEMLTSQGKNLEKQKGEIKELFKAYEYLHKATQSSVRKVAFERYNPFSGVGSNQSFTLTLLDSFNTGVVITSLHSRDSTRVYAKAIRQGKPLHNLSGEEERVFKNALLMKDI